VPSGGGRLLERRRSGSARIEVSRKLDDKPRTTAGRVLDPRAPAMHQHELTHNRQANSTSTDRSIGLACEPIIRLPDLFALTARNSRPAILYRDKNG
jgi:hypothetical protein